MAQLCDSERDSDDRCEHDGDQNAAPHIFDGQDNGENQTDQEDPEHRTVKGCDSRNGQSRLRFIRAELYDAHIQESQVSDKCSDTAADCQLQRSGDRFDHDLADFCDSDQDVQKAADEDHRHGLLPGKAETETYRIGKKGVQSHTGRLGIRNIGKQPHDQGANDGSDNRCQENCAPFHAGRRQYRRIDGNNISHCKERRDAGGDLSGDGGMVFLQLKKLFHENFPPDCSEHVLSCSGDCRLCDMQPAESVFQSHFSIIKGKFQFFCKKNLKKV